MALTLLALLDRTATLDHVSSSEYSTEFDRQFVLFKDYVKHELYSHETTLQSKCLLWCQICSHASRHYAASRALDVWLRSHWSLQDVRAFNTLEERGFQPTDLLSDEVNNVIRNLCRPTPYLATGTFSIINHPERL